MRVFAAVVLGAGTPAEVVERTGLPAREVAGALRRLTDGGLVGRRRRRWSRSSTAFKEAARSTPTSAPADEPLDPDRARAAVLRTFIVDGRLIAIPAAQGKRRVVLEHIVAAFEPGVQLPGAGGRRGAAGLARRLRRAAPLPRSTRA